MLLEKVKKNLIEKNLIKQGDRVVVGVSGGADSVCLLISLYTLKKEMGFSLVAAHLNHGIRKEADDDERFVRNLCEKLDIEFVSKKVNVAEVAREKNLSEEEAGRNERYKFFRESFPGAKIAVAHNADDQAETVLFNVARGSSLAGLSGMKEVSDDVIRPLLNISRAEIEEFLKKIGQDFVIDKTNLEDKYSRNKIRHNVLPYLNDEINSNAREHLVSLAGKAREADEFVRDEAWKFIRENGVVSEDRKEASLDLDKMSGLAKVLKKKIVYEAIAQIAGSKKDITERHIEIVLDLEGANVSARISLPYGVLAKRDYERIVIQKEGDKIEAPELSKPNEGLKNAKIFSYKNGMIIPEKEFTKWFDYDKIKGGLVWRFREEGDRIALAKTGEKKLSRFMIDEKIPGEKRDALPLLADGENILWILGYRINENYKITSETKRVIEIVWEE